MEVADGVTEEEAAQAAEAIAKIHATFWNNEEMLSNPALFTDTDLNVFFNGLKVTDESLVAPFLEKLSVAAGDALPPKFAKFSLEAVKSLEQWLWKPESTGNRTIVTADYRTENVVWRKTGPETYEPVVLDHQIWTVTNAPMRDMACFL